MTKEFSRSRRPSEIDLEEKESYSKEQERKNIGDPSAPEDQRSPFERDRDRILYSRRFRRLKDVTQVARADESYLYHDRLTHSLKVAQVGRRLAETLEQAYGPNEQHEDIGGDNSKSVGTDYIDHDTRLAKMWRQLAKTVDRVRSSEGDHTDDVKFPDLGDYLDPDVVEAACLAHDIGHPPFGHVSEELLDDLVDTVTAGDTDSISAEQLHKNGDLSPARVDRAAQSQGFEGNAQTFRIVTRLGAHRRDDSGLDLTRATLNAIEKYPWERDADNIQTDQTESDEKWGYYPSEEKFFRFARAGTDQDRGKVLEAEIMDWADDVTYAIHDVEDFYRGGLIPLHKFFREVREIKKGIETAEENRDRETEDCGKEKQGDTAGSNKAKRAYQQVKEVSEESELAEFARYISEETDIEVTKGDVVFFFHNLQKSAYFQKSLLSSFNGTPEERNELRHFSSGLVERYLEAQRTDQNNRESIELKRDDADNQPTLDISDEFKQHISILKKLTVYYVITDQTLAAQQEGHLKIIQELFEKIYNAIGEGNIASSVIIEPYQSYVDALLPDVDSEDEISDIELNGESAARIAADMIAAMTEPQAVRFHQRLQGERPGSLQNEIVR